MKKVSIIFLLVLASFHLLAQNEIGSSKEGTELYSKARTYMQKADYANAIMVYNQAVNVEPDNLLYRKELAHAYYMQGDMIKAEKMIVPLLKDKNADEETFQVASRIYRAMKKTEDAKNAINKGIEIFPKAGGLYAEKGEIYTQEKKYEMASKAWESGIENAPTYHTNYYNLSKVYYFTKKYLWAITYGETFVNIESFSTKSEEIKKIIFESYKYLMADLSNTALDGKINRFENPKNYEEACLKIFDNLRPVVTGGINVDNLTQLRIRFLIEWNKYFAKIYPFELNDYQQRIILNKHYECYNQWLFGALDNTVLYKSWTQKNANEMNLFDTYFRNKKLHPLEKQYYRINN